MNRLFVSLAAAALLFAAGAPAALACDDNSDQVVKKLQKLDLNTEQLKRIFAYQADHKNYIQKSHREGLGCLHHEKHVLVFEKQAVGILTDAQFKTYAGRERTEEEQLRYQNHLLKTEIERLKAELTKVKAELEKVKNSDAKKDVAKPA